MREEYKPIKEKLSTFTIRHKFNVVKIPYGMDYSGQRRHGLQWTEKAGITVDREGMDYSGQRRHGLQWTEKSAGGSRYMRYDIGYVAVCIFKF